MTLHALVAAARDRLRLAGIGSDDAALDAELLAREALGWDRAQYLCRRQERAPASFEAAYGGLIARRERREPVSLITGRREFWGLDFVVTPDVLAPRPETELIVEEALTLIDRLCAVQPLSPGGGEGSASAASGGEGTAPRNCSVRLQPDGAEFFDIGGATLPPSREATADRRSLGGGGQGCPGTAEAVPHRWPASAGGGAETPISIVDVGTGSGCLAIALARELPGAKIAATDVSPAALAIAQRNAARLGVEGRISWHTTRFLEGFDHPIDLIVSNPPYVADADWLPPEVGRFEPPLALCAGPEGLDAIRELVRQAAAHLTAGGALIFELGAGQAPAVGELVSSQPGLALDRIRDDLQDIPRVAVVRRVGTLNSEP